MCTARPNLKWNVIPNSPLRTIQSALIRAQCMELPLKYSGGSFPSGAMASHGERVSATDEPSSTPGTKRPFGNAVWLYNKDTGLVTVCITYSFANSPFYETACEDAERRPAK